MTIGSDVNTALTAVLANTYASTLPDAPTWPAIMFEIESEREDGWTIGAEYEQHIVTVNIMSTSKAQIATLRPQIETAMEGVDQYMGLEDHGDASYEGDARVYAYYMDFRIRTRELT